MNKKKLVALFLAATTVSTMVFAGCGSTEEKKETSTEKTDDTKPDKDQTLNLVGYDYTSLDPAQVSDTDSFTSMNQVFEGLMREQTDIKGNTKIVNAGAEKVDVSSYFNVFLGNGSNNKGHFSSKEYDELVTKAATEADPAKRIDLYKKAENILVNEEVAASPSFYRDINSFRKNYVKGSTFNNFGGYYDLSQVYIEGKEK